MVYSAKQSMLFWWNGFSRYLRSDFYPHKKFIFHILLSRNVNLVVSVTLLSQLLHYLIYRRDNYCTWPNKKCPVKHLKYFGIFGKCPEICSSKNWLPSDNTVVKIINYFLLRFHQFFWCTVLVRFSQRLMSFLTTIFFALMMRRKTCMRDAL